MNTIEIRDLDQARQFVQEGLWLQRVAVPHADRVRQVLGWALEVAGAGLPLPPVGFLADLGFLLLGGESGQASTQARPELPANLLRRYEDLVLGKLLGDSSIGRASDALRHFKEEDRSRGLVFTLQQLQERTGIAGVLLSPGVIKGLLELPPQEVLNRGWDQVSREGFLACQLELYEALIAAMRRSAELLGPEDIFELEHGTALLEMGQRVALRQVLQAAAHLEATLPVLRPRLLSRRHEVPTRILDEDLYPVGGYSSITNRGSIESLLHSQLACMEDERPDLFDARYLRDELLYYARDENQFLRRRRTFVIGLLPDLVQARFKDAGLPWQRGILVLGLIVAAVRKLTDWLSSDALLFDVLIIEGDRPGLLAEEQQVLKLVFREQIANGTVRLGPLPRGWRLAWRGDSSTNASLCHTLLASTGKPAPLFLEAMPLARLEVAGPEPRLGLSGEEPATVPADGLMESWSETLAQLVYSWV